VHVGVMQVKVQVLGSCLLLAEETCGEEACGAGRGHGLHVAARKGLREVGGLWHCQAAQHVTKSIPRQSARAWGKGRGGRRRRMLTKGWTQLGEGQQVQSGGVATCRCSGGRSW
jgi:hypothetical protein